MKSFSWENKKVLVTGGNGFIGGSLIRSLLARGAVIFVLTHNDKGSFGEFFTKREKRDICCIPGDVRDYSILATIFTRYRIDTCFHLAAQPIVLAGYDSPLTTFDTNIGGTVNILEACRCSKFFKRLIIASTTHVYGNNQELPFVESLTVRPTRPYETSKACADFLAQTYFYTYGLPVAITRMTNTYGPGDTNFSRLIPKLMRAVTQGEHPIILGGKIVRDYLYVKDAVNGYLAVAENLHREEVKGQAFNFGSGDIFSVKEIAQKILHVQENKRLTLKIIENDTNQKEVDIQYVSTVKAKAILGWTPQYSLTKGLKETHRWYKKMLICI